MKAAATPPVPPRPKPKVKPKAWAEKSALALASALSGEEVTEIPPLDRAAARKW